MLKIKVSMNKLGDFIEGELKRRDMSLRRFADIVGVHHSTLIKAMRPEPPEPSLDFLRKLAKATGVNVLDLVALVLPEDSNVDGEVRVIAERIARLPADRREIVDTYLMGSDLKESD